MTKPLSLCHWGPFEADIEDGRLVGARPMRGSGADPQMIGALPELVYADTRISQPFVRQGGCATGQLPTAPTGVPTEWFRWAGTGLWI